MRRGSLAVRQAGFALLVGGGALALGLGLDAWLDRPLLSAVMALTIMAPIAVLAAWQRLSRMLSLFRALAGTVSSYRDGDFSFSLVWPDQGELGELVRAHNQLGTALREQRLALVERELLLDTMVQQTPVAMLLIDPSERVVYSNLAARKLLGDGRRLEGRPLAALLGTTAPAVREAVERGGDGLFAVPATAEGEDEDEVFHLARRRFRLNGRTHELFLIRRLTAELRRQEVQTWKKVIRVISHELNNSLAPIVSLAHSGTELLKQGRGAELDLICTTIEDRARHLDRFIQGYARFAKLPAPRLEAVDWPGFIERLSSQVGFRVAGPLPDGPARFDAAQLEQALLNLLVNAHESGSDPAEVSLRVRRLPPSLRIEVADRGAGMSDAVLASALVPFYSTKRSGTGLGLALAREIAEAHGGRVALTRRDGGGMLVTLVLPDS